MHLQALLTGSPVDFFCRIDLTPLNKITGFEQEITNALYETYKIVANDPEVVTITHYKYC